MTQDAAPPAPPSDSQPALPASSERSQSFFARHKLASVLGAIAAAAVGGWIGHGATLGGAKVTAGGPIQASELQALTAKSSRCYSSPVPPQVQRICQAASEDYYRRLRSERS